jgi:hypothetical protein
MIRRAPLLALGYGSFLTLVSVGNAVAQDENTSPANTPVTPADNSTGAQTPANGQAPALPADATPSDNSQNTSRAQVPDASQTPVNPQPTSIPLFPAQLGNPLSPYNSSSVNPQSPQLTQPTLFVTGVRDVSQIATNTALTHAFTQPQTQGGDILGDESIMNYEHPPIERIKLGPFDLQTAAVTSVVADDNFRGSGQNDNTKKSDCTFALTPALSLVYGAHDGQKGYATLVYAPTLTRLYHDSSEDTDDQNVAFNAIYPFQRLTVNLSETYTETTGTNTDSNSRSTQNTNFTSVGASYAFDDKISLNSQFQATVTTFEGQNAAGQNATGDSVGEGGTTTSINNTLNYRFSEKLSAGPNFNVGWDDPDGQDKSTYEQGLLSLNYAPTEKIGLFAAGGAEFRQYDQGGDSTISPVFTLGLGYAPFDSTTLALSASQAVHSSTAAVGEATSGEMVKSTTVGATVTQRIVQRIFVSFTFAYEHDEDSNENNGGTTNGGGTTNDNLTYRPSVNFNPTAWSSITLYYQYLSNKSDFQGESYNDNQVGLAVSAQF